MHPNPPKVPRPPPDEENKSALRFMSKDGDVDWHAVLAQLRVYDDESLKDALLTLYRLDWVVAYYINEKLLALAIADTAGGTTLPLAPAPTGESGAWLSADTYCESCPGSEYTDYGGGLVLPLCGNNGRPDRYQECQKFREVLQESQLDPDTLEEQYQKVAKQYEELHDEYFGRPETSGHVDQDEGSDPAGDGRE